MEQLANLPPLAIIVFGATLAVIFGVRYMGLMAGEKAPPEKAASSAQVAAVIVDPTALNRLTAAGEALNMTLMESNKIARERNEIDEERNRVYRLVATELDRIREELRIQREIGRRER